MPLNIVPLETRMQFIKSFSTLFDVSTHTHLLVPYFVISTNLEPLKTAPNDPPTPSP